MEIYGAKYKLPDIRDYRLATLQTEYPFEFELPMQYVHDQMTISSCVAHALASVSEYYNAKQHGLETRMSPGYIYGNREETEYQGYGMYVRDAVAKMCEDGTVPMFRFPFDREVPEIVKLVQKHKPKLDKEARQYRFSEYIATKNEKEIKTALMAGIPVIASLSWYSSPLIDDFDIIHFDHSKAPYLHCVIIYGWDANGWKIQNSWGKKWGNEGCAVCPYSEPLAEAFAVIDTHVDTLEIRRPFQAKTPLGKYIYTLLNRIVQFCETYWGSTKKWLSLSL